ncbi:MAG: lamin tail domain-containing protein, partial [Pirellulaceae bacterium]|nr:lamin tail domain-containing protein [Pirellulaceae bacterium]
MTRRRSSYLARFESLEPRIVLDSTVVFNELMVNPVGSDDDTLEWVELFNQMAVDMDLSGWSLQGGIEYEFADGAEIPGRGYLVIAIDPVALQGTTGLTGVLGPYTGKLNNGGETLELRNNDNRLMNRVTYDFGGQWPVGPDGSGFTLAKNELLTASHLPENWTTSGQAGGTPGAENFPPAPEPVTTSLIDVGDQASVLVPADGGLGLSWTLDGFAEVGWTSGPTGIGYEQTGGSSIAYGNLTGAGGSFPSSNAFGHDFEVLTPITVTHLGVFDSNANGLSRTLTSELWTRSGNSGAKLATLTFTPGDPGTLVESNRLKPLASPLALSPGDYTIVAHGYGSGEYVGHQGIGGPSGAYKTLDDGDGAILFEGTSRIGAMPGSFPNLPDAGNANYYSAGTFQFSTGSITGKVVTDIHAEMFDENTSAFIRIPFDFNISNTVQSMSLEMEYSDGFVAYINGEEVSRRNASGIVDWNSAATTHAGGFVTEIINIDAGIDDLNFGSNVLAIHGLNAVVNDATFFIAPALEIVSLPPGAEPVVPVAINEVAPGGQSGFFLELSNESAVSQSLDGFFLESSAGQQYTIPAQSISGGDVWSVTDLQLGFTPADGDTLFLYTSSAKTNLIDARQVSGWLRGRSSQHDGDWLYPDVATPGAVNSFTFHDEIVINEIMYHHQPDKGPPFVESSEEWIELYNRSATITVDLSGWSFVDAVDFTFPVGTMLGPDQYLLVSNNVAVLSAIYPAANMIGDFSRSLSDRDDRILLLDANDNPADEVHYYHAGRWPESADGGGSSLELRDPDADNSIPEAWAASDESSKSTWNTYSFRQVAKADTGSANVWNELHMGLLDAGEFLLDDVSVIRDPSGLNRQLIQNGSFEGDSVGGTADKWRIIGTHNGTVIVDPDDTNNQVAHVVATGLSGHMHNHAETTLKDGANFHTIQNGVEYEISFRAKWLTGSNQLNTRFYVNRVRTTHLLAVPQLNGTPGAQNSTFVANVGPTYRDFSHSALVPEVSENVTVTATAEDPDGVASMTLWFSVAEGPWQSAPMTLGPNSQYTGIIPGQSASAIVQFYVEGQDTFGATSTFPAEGVDSRALYKVQDGKGTNNPVDTIRIVMLASEAADLFDAGQLMSNGFRGGTVIYNNLEAFYDIGVRLKGSLAGRTPILGDVNSGSYKVRFNSDQLFRGVHEVLSLDGSGRSQYYDGNGQDEILITHMLSRAGGIASVYHDLGYLISPNTNSQYTRPVIMMMARYSDVYLEETFGNDSDGTLYEFEIVYYMNQNVVSGNKETLKNGMLGGGFVPTDFGNIGTEKEDYRWNYLIKNKRAADNYDNVMSTAQAFSLSGAILDSVLEDVIDVSQWMRMYAMQSLSGNLDVYGIDAAPHNIWLYDHPGTGKIMVLPWDLDFSFAGRRPPNDTLHAESGAPNWNIGKILNRPQNLRLFYGHLQDLIATTFNGTYAGNWFHRFGVLVDQNYTPHISFINDRAHFVTTQLSLRAPSVPYDLTTSGPLDVGAATTATLTGTGWIDVHEMRLAGQSEPLDLTWSVGSGATYAQTWQTTIPLLFGTNQYELEAYDYQGHLVGTESIQVSTSAGNLVFDSLRITQINYNPADPTLSEFASNPNLDNDDFEFIQVENIGAQSINLQGVSFGSGVTYSFGNVNLAPGARGVVVRDQSAFELRYGMGLNVLGEFTSGALSNQGEGLSLTFNGQTFLDFSYGDDDPWPEGADGAGQTLVLSDPVGTPTQDYGDFDRWRGSTEWGGAPDATPASPIGVVINEVLTNSELPQVDSIELYNSTGSLIDISGWWLSDDQGEWFKFQIPATTTIPAGGYLVLDESDFNPNPSTPSPTDFALNANDGDSVWLIDPNVSGTEPEFFVDSVVFGAVTVGETLGRWPNGSGRLVPLTVATLGATNGAPRVGPVVISEIMYNPTDPGGETAASDLEFAEIYNPTAQPVDLSDWVFDGIGLTIPTSTLLQPGQTMVFVPFDPVNDLLAVAAFENAYSIEIASSLAQFVGPVAGNLDGGGERLTLQRAGNPPLGSTSIPLWLEDRVEYNDTAPWPTDADGGGMSLHRVLSDSWAGDVSSWSSASPSPGQFGPSLHASLVNATKTIGEVGQLTNVTHDVQTIDLTQSYNTPVVFALPVSHNGSDVTVPRITNIQSNQFDIHLVEPSNLNGVHGIGETVSYIVLETGNHVLPDGTRIDVETVSTNDYVGKGIAAPSWETVTFSTPFATTPVVISQVQEMAIGGENFLSTRQNTTSTVGFDVALEPQESSAAGSVTETIGFLAMEPSTGTWNSMTYEAQLTAALFTDDFVPLSFSNTYETSPSFVAGLATANGGDNAHLRYQNLTKASVEVIVEEDTT